MDCRISCGLRHNDLDAKELSHAATLKNDNTLYLLSIMLKEFGFIAADFRMQLFWHEKAGNEFMR